MRRRHRHPANASTFRTSIAAARAEVFSHDEAVIHRLNAWHFFRDVNGEVDLFRGGHAARQRHSAVVRTNRDVAGSQPAMAGLSERTAHVLYQLPVSRSVFAGVLRSTRSD